ncbi:glycosyltransferase [Ochrobactrum sp. EDr1-4]|uniref:glycosyltransferase n=1 Tax=Ochrobactrum sp. EDr1-4 TaxID=3368622 RepID=UPI003B9E3E27
MDLSIIIPMYNVELYLRECLDSVANSLKPDFRAEVICINDGSTDSTRQIAEQYSAQYPQFRLINQRNGGYGKAINTGLNAAAGSLFTIVESDDVILDNAYTKLVEILRNDHSVDFVKTPYQPFTDLGKNPIIAAPRINLSASDVLNDKSKSIKPTDFLHDELCFTPPAIWAGVYRRSSFEQLKIRLPETPGAAYQDTCFSTLSFLNGLRYYWLNDHYYMYRIDREDASRHVKNRRNEIVDIFEFIKDNLVRNNNFDDESKPYFYALYFRRLVWFLKRVREDYQFTLFINLYRSFDEVWGKEGLRANVKSLLPGFEAELFDKFYNGRHAELYI